MSNRQPYNNYYNQYNNNNCYSGYNTGNNNFSRPPGPGFRSGNYVAGNGNASRSDSWYPQQYNYSGRNNSNFGRQNHYNYYKNKPEQKQAEKHDSRQGFNRKSDQRPIQTNSGNDKKCLASEPTATVVESSTENERERLKKVKEDKIRLSKLLSSSDCLPSMHIDSSLSVQPLNDENKRETVFDKRESCLTLPTLEFTESDYKEIGAITGHTLRNEEDDIEESCNADSNNAHLSQCLQSENVEMGNALPSSVDDLTEKLLDEITESALESHGSSEIAENVDKLDYDGRVRKSTQEILEDNGSVAGSNCDDDDNTEELLQDFESGFDKEKDERSRGGDECSTRCPSNERCCETIYDTDSTALCYDSAPNDSDQTVTEYQQVNNGNNLTSKTKKNISIFKCENSYNIVRESETIVGYINRDTLKKSAAQLESCKSKTQTQIYGLYKRYLNYRRFGKKDVVKDKMMRLKENNVLDNPYLNKDKLKALLEQIANETQSVSSNETDSCQVVAEAENILDVTDVKQSEQVIKQVLNVPAEEAADLFMENYGHLLDESFTIPHDVLVQLGLSDYLDEFENSESDDDKANELCGDAISGADVRQSSSMHTPESPNEDDTLGENSKDQVDDENDCFQGNVTVKRELLEEPSSPNVINSSNVLDTESVDNRSVDWSSHGPTASSYESYASVNSDLQAVDSTVLAPNVSVVSDEQSNNVTDLQAIDQIAADSNRCTASAQVHKNGNASALSKTSSVGNQTNCKDERLSQNNFRNSISKNMKKFLITKKLKRKKLYLREEKEQYLEIFKNLKVGDFLDCVVSTAVETATSEVVDPATLIIQTTVDSILKNCEIPLDVERKFVRILGWLKRNQKQKDAHEKVCSINPGGGTLQRIEVATSTPKPHISKTVTDDCTRPVRKIRTESEGSCKELLTKEDVNKLPYRTPQLAERIIKRRENGCEKVSCPISSNTKDERMTKNEQLSDKSDQVKETSVTIGKVGKDKWTAASAPTCDQHLAVADMRGSSQPLTTIRRHDDIEISQCPNTTLVDSSSSIDSKTLQLPNNMNECLDMLMNLDEKIAVLINKKMDIYNLIKSNIYNKDNQDSKKSANDCVLSTPYKSAMCHAIDSSAESNDLQGPNSSLYYSIQSNNTPTATETRQEKGTKKIEPLKLKRSRFNSPFTVVNNTEVDTVDKKRHHEQIKKVSLAKDFVGSDISEKKSARTVDSSRGVDAVEPTVRQTRSGRMVKVVNSFNNEEQSRKKRSFPDQDIDQIGSKKNKSDSSCTEITTRMQDSTSDLDTVNMKEGTSSEGDAVDSEETSSYTCRKSRASSVLPGEARLSINRPHHSLVNTRIKGCYINLSDSKIPDNVLANSLAIKMTTNENKMNDESENGSKTIVGSVSKVKPSRIQKQDDELVSVTSKSDRVTRVKRNRNNGNESVSEIVVCDSPRITRRRGQTSISKEVVRIKSEPISEDPLKITEDLDSMWDSSIAICCIKVHNDSLYFGSEDGRTYRIMPGEIQFSHIYFGHASGVNTIGVYDRILATGSSDSTLVLHRLYGDHGPFVTFNVGEPVQTLCIKWATIFVGTKNGKIARYSCTKYNEIGEKFVIGNSSDYVLAVEAAKEGPRKIIIVAVKSSPPTIRDANTGLLLRSVNFNDVFYSLAFHGSTPYVYCGTRNNSVVVIDFTTGESIDLIGLGKGVVKLIIKWDLIFTCSYDGLVHIYNIPQRKLIAKVPFAGVITEMEVWNNKIILSTTKQKPLFVDFPDELTHFLEDESILVK